MKYLRPIGAATAAALATGAFAITSNTASATTSQSSSTSIAGVAVPMNHRGDVKNVLHNANSHDLLQLLFAGAGPIAEANPSMPRQLGFAPNRQKPSTKVLNEIISRYLKVRPDFATTIAPLLKSGDAIKVQTGLTKFKEDFAEFYRTDPSFAAIRKAVEDNQIRISKSSAASPDGRTNVVSGVNVVYGVNVVVAASVLAGTVGAAATFVVVVGAALLWYLAESTPGSSVDSANQTAQMVEAFV